MPYILRDATTGYYYVLDITSDERRPYPKDDPTYARVINSEEDAIATVAELTKKFNAQFETYKVLLENGKWDPAWPVPMESKWECIEMDGHARLPDTKDVG